METRGTPDTSSSAAPHADHATCARCGGLLLGQHYMDLLDDTGQIDITAWHCTMCGEVVDAVILKNRQSPPPNLLYGTKARKFSQRVADIVDSSASEDASDETESSQAKDKSSRESDEEGV